MSAASGRRSASGRAGATTGPRGRAGDGYVLLMQAALRAATLFETQADEMRREAGWNPRRNRGSSRRAEDEHRAIDDVAAGSFASKPRCDAARRHAAALRVLGAKAGRSGALPGQEGLRLHI